MTPVLALDWSSRRLSVATRDTSGSVRESHLQLSRFHGPDALTLLERHLDERRLHPAELRRIRLGRGPGNFSGIRLAFAWAAGLMAPGGTELECVSSGRALARRLSATIDDFVIAGDARRGLWWGMRVRGGQTTDWEILPPEIWRERMRGLPVFSAEPERIDGIEDLREAFPGAVDLLADGLSPEAAEPLYLHAAVDP